MTRHYIQLLLLQTINNKYQHKLIWKYFYTNFFAAVQIFFVKTEIRQRSHIYKIRDMYTNSNEGIVFQSRCLVGAYGVKKNPWKSHPD